MRPHPTYLKSLSLGGKLSMKRKPGGTLVGNFIRQFASNATHGALGQGAMMLREGETPKQANIRLVKGIGAGVIAASDAAAQSDVLPANTTVLEAAKQGGIGQKLTQFLVPAVLIIGGILTAVGIYKLKKR